MIPVKEFWENASISPVIKTYASKYADFNDLWVHCDRADLMFWLLQQLEYKNANKLWQLYKQIQKHSKRDLPPEQLNSYLEEINNFVDKFKSDLKNSVDKGEQTKDSAKNSYLAGAWIYTRLALQQTVEDKVFSEKFHAAIKARLEIANIVFSKEGKVISKNEITESDERQIDSVREKAGKDMEIKIYEQQSNIFREVIGNPFLLQNQVDFNYIPDFD